MEAHALPADCPKPYMKWMAFVFGMIFFFLIYASYLYIHGDPEVAQAEAAVASSDLTLPTVTLQPVVLTGGNPWTVDEDAEEEEGGYKGQPGEIPPKGKYIPPEDASASNVFILTEHTNEEDDYEKPTCKRLEESGERYSESETVYHGEV